MLVCIWCLSLLEWVSLQIALLEQKLILTADSQKQGDLVSSLSFILLFLFCLSHFLWLQQGFLQGGIGCSGLLWLEFCLFVFAVVYLCVCVSVSVCVCVCVCLRSAGAHSALRLCSLLPGHHSWSRHHNICHSKANITLTTSRLRAISSRMQCCCHSWFSFL